MAKLSVFRERGGEKRREEEEGREEGKGKEERKGGDLDDLTVVTHLGGTHT